MKKLLSILLVVAMLTAFALPAIATEAIETTEPTTEAIETTEPTAETEYDIQITSDIVIDERIHNAEGYCLWYEFGKLDAIVAGKEFKGITMNEFYQAVIEAYGGCSMGGWSDSGSDTAWTAGSVHQGTIEFTRQSEETGKISVLFAADVKIVVQETNIESITVDPITVYEGGYVKTYNYSAVVTYKDGTTEEIFVAYQDEWPTEIGTYEKTGYVYNYVEIPVTIQVVPFDTDIDVQITSDIVIDETIHNTYGKYLWRDYGKLDAIVAGKEFKGITLDELAQAFNEAYGYCHIDGSDDQYQTRWTVGSTHECSIEIRQWSEETGGRTLVFATPVNVSVQETNIESITAKPITVYEGVWEDTDKYTAIVTYKDGSTGKVPMYYWGERPTEIGTYEVTGYIFEDVEIPATIHVVPFTVDIQITSDIVIDEKIHYEDGYCAWFDYGKLNAVVAGQEFKGITPPELEQAVSEAYGDCDIHWSHDGSMDWTVGSSCVCKIEIRHWSEETDDYMLLFASDVNIVVQETNIESVAAEPVTIYEGGVDPELAYPAVVTYKDGSTGEAPMYFYAEELPTKIGTYEVTGYVYKCIEIPVTVYVVARPNSGQDEITVEDGVATVPDSAVEVTEGEDVVIDVTGTEEKADSVVLGAETVDKIADAEAPVEVKLPDASLSFDKTAIGSINEQAGESPVTIVAKKAAESTLNAQQTAALEKTKVCAVLTVEAFAGKTKIPDFGGGKVTISIPFELPEGKEGKDFYVAYVADDGTVTAMPTTYADGKLTFETTHFSSYVVVDKSAAAEAAPSSPQTGDSSHILLVTALMVVSAAALVVCTTKRRAF